MNFFVEPPGLTEDRVLWMEGIRGLPGLGLIFLAALTMGLSTYVYRAAPPEELTPTLTAGVTFDHMSSVGVPFLAGALLPIINFQGIFLGSAILILISIPFARAFQVQTGAATNVALSPAE